MELEFDIKKIEIPTNPGVYLMKNSDKVIYVGKAKNLRKRVLSYFNREHESEKTRELVRHIRDIEFIICNSELDAFILENNLIKKYQPKYNILLKDEKTYPYIKLSKEKFPTISIIRTTRALNLKNGEYYGPYPNGAWNLKKILVKVFKIRDCSKNMEKKHPRPCLKYYMKFCPAPCVYKELEEYDEIVENVRSVLRGNTGEIIKNLQKKMEELSKNMQFEEAITVREQIRELNQLEVNQINEYGKDLDEDIFGVKIQGNRVFICVLNVREGKVIGKISTNIDISDKIYDNIVENTVMAYYVKHIIPKNIVFSQEVENECENVKVGLENISGKRINFYFPKIKSRRKDLVEMCELNLQKDMEDYYRKVDTLEQGMKTIYDILKLKNYPRKIECFDISNTQGKDAVAAMSVSVEGRPSKKDYRKFKIKTKDTPDDYTMMREVITRRYSKLPENQFPDIILIDGGLGHINVAGEVLKELEKDNISDLLSLAEAEEEIYKYGEKEPYVFPREWEALKIFQRVRDEAHRFGVTYHRKLRSKRVISSELDNIKGIGKKRKELLLKEFGSYSEIKKQSVERLSMLIPEKIAVEILKNN